MMKSKFAAHGDEVAFASVEEFAVALCEAFPYVFQRDGDMVTIGSWDVSDDSDDREWFYGLFDLMIDEQIPWKDFVDYCQSALEVDS